MLKSNNALTALHKIFYVLVYTTLQLNPFAVYHGRTKYECSSVPDKVPEKFSETGKNWKPVRTAEWKEMTM